MSSGTCTIVKTNSHTHDFHCDLAAGHSEPHRDPVTGTRWRHPGQPYGVRKLHTKNMGHPRTKPKVSWSARPADGYKPGPVEATTVSKKGAVA